MQPEDKGKSPSNNSTTPRSGKRKRRATISPVAGDQASPTPKNNKAKINLYFSEKAKGFPAQGKNILNLPYTKSEDEEEQEVDLTKHVATEHDGFPSPTPREDLVEQVTRASSRKPRSERIN